MLAPNPVQTLAELRRPVPLPTVGDLALVHSPCGPATDTTRRRQIAQKGNDRCCVRIAAQRKTQLGSKALLQRVIPLLLLTSEPECGVQQQGGLDNPVVIAAIVVRLLVLNQSVAERAGPVLVTCDRLILRVIKYDTRWFCVMEWSTFNDQT